ncbi:DUF6125 family protein [Desulfopila sp. IMCC35008]|uniref:DUF6125 family protein n=1 Tax=Desulfopila sp. IMCC35008 TaxID=2653858 RepID=UPI0013D69987|nr:DUF6125 family protein [Desulfopila sp. IMCC35008]
MFDQAQDVNELDHKQTAAYIVDLFHRNIVHHTLWYTEVRHQMGEEKALKILNSAARTSARIQMKHLSSLFGFEMDDGIPSPLLDLEPAKLQELRTRMAKNWLVSDGVWFQTIEFAEGMNEAKRCNDSCWAHFSPFEAASIKEQLGLVEQPGLEGLKRALGFRLYANINKQSIHDETESAFVFRMDDCRVQSARKRKGLDDYPCKSAGLVEYSYFARAIDARITTECIGCPPDPHPDDWFCSWRFSIKE